MHNIILELIFEPSIALFVAFINSIISVFNIPVSNQKIADYLRDNAKTSHSIKVLILLVLPSLVIDYYHFFQLNFILTIPVLVGIFLYAFGIYSIEILMSYKKDALVPNNIPSFIKVYFIKIKHKIIKTSLIVIPYIIGMTIGIYSYIEYNSNSTKNMATVSFMLVDNKDIAIKKCPILINNQLQISKDDGIVRFELDTLLLKKDGYEYNVIKIPCENWKEHQGKRKSAKVGGEIKLSIETE